MSVSYTYDDSGIRTSKTVNGTKTQYYLNGSTILTQITGDDRFDFFYDENGLLLGFSYNGAKYYYIRNLQSDIIGILDNSGNQVVSYMYDSWGKLLSIDGSAKDTIGVQNPFRYRGYYYDTETELYYLNSRYYDPMVGRFLNADGVLNPDSLYGVNLYAYSLNNSINMADDSGQLPFLLVAAGAGFLAGLASQFIGDLVTSAVNGSWQFSSWQTYVGAGIGGAVGGILAPFVGPTISTTIGAGASTFIGQTLEKFTGGQNRSMSEIVTNTVVDATVGGVVNKVLPVKVSGITAGRNSMSAVYQSGLTKLQNHTVSHMSFKVVTKGFTSNVVSDLNFTVGAGIVNGMNAISRTTDNRSNSINEIGLIYWCTP